MLRAIIFDFNGIILNDEPIHFRAMREAVAGLAITLTEEDYWNKYLPLDDWQCLAAICSDNRVTLSDEERLLTLARKSQQYHEFLKGQYPLFPGAAELVLTAAEHYPLALASGARRKEIECALRTTNLIHCFRVVVAAEDFTRGKPHPESFLLALARLNERLDGSAARIEPEECLVIEDSVGGVRGARAAGMKCLAVSNSYPRERLLEANLVVSSLEEIALDSLATIFKGPS